MTAERAIELLSNEAGLLDVPLSELDEVCQMACDALRLYSHSFQQAYSLNAAIADYYRNLGLPMERLEELAAADKAGRLVTLPDVSCTDADGEEALRRAMWDCNYKNNGVTRFTADAIAEKLSNEAWKVRPVIKTPMGDIVVEASTDSDNPGVWISFHRDEEEYEPTLVLVEYTATEADHKGPAIITRVWGEAENGEYTDRVIHTGLGKDELR